MKSIDKNSRLIILFWYDDHQIDRFKFKRSDGAGNAPPDQSIL